MAQVTVRCAGNLLQLAAAGGHGFVLDEPLSDGGDGLGPSPYDLLLSALGGCTAMTLLLYARRKGWPLQQVEVTLDQERVHAADCRACEKSGGYLHRITRRVRLEGPLDEEQRARLEEIAARCPVHRTLTSPIEIVDEFKYE
ncbi:MAG: OsmC family protein [Anaerolineae bacterium]